MSTEITIKLIQKELIDGISLKNYVDDETSRRMWWSSLELIQKQYLSQNYQEGGMWFAAPLPALNEAKYLNNFTGWLWAPEGFPYFNYEDKCLPSDQSHIRPVNVGFTKNYKILNLNFNDSFEPFLMVITPKFQCILTIYGAKDKKNLIVRGDESTLKKVIELVDKKLSQDDAEESKKFQNNLKNFGKLSINHEFASNFWPSLSMKFAKMVSNSNNIQVSFNAQSDKSLKITEAKLLEAISHEVRTPLATIKTLISSTLKKYEMDEKIKNRLIQIDNECTEQIDRFGLIFNAAELVRSDSSPPQQLTSINLGEILQKLSPSWIKQLSRRGISLEIDIPSELPEVLSNSEKLELMLGGLIDKNTRGLQQGSILTLELRPAGQKLRLQLIVRKKDSYRNHENTKDDGSDIGPVLNWNPQTGSLQISQSATQKLLASLGGYVTRRKNSGLTVFFPISEINQ